MTLRRADTSDAEALSLVGAATFLESYALSLPGRAIVEHCPKAHAVDVYAAWLTDSRCAVWVAVVGDGTVVGFAVLTPCDLPDVQDDDLELRRIYLLSRFQGGGTGRAMVQAAAQEAKVRGAKRLVLGVYGENERAQSFYRHLGFERIGRRDFVVGPKVCLDYV
ncbi:GNAT family N-acetyltransferase, partial [bacterium]